MNLNKTKIALLAASYFVAMGLFAQQKHEVSIYGGGGLSTLDYKIKNVNSDDVKFKGGAIAGVGYTFFMNEQWGISTGAEYTTYKVKASIYSVMDAHEVVDDYDDPFFFVIQQKGLVENQEATYINIPIMAQFQIQDGSGFYAALGGKIGLPLKKGKYKYSYDGLVNKAFYPDENVWYDDLEYRGLGEFGGRSGKEDLDFKVAFTLSAEAGMKWGLNDNMSLYSGVYADYGLNNVVKAGKNQQFLPYNHEDPTDFKNNSILNSEYTHYQEKNKALTGKVKPLAVGLKIKLAFTVK